MPIQISIEDEVKRIARAEAQRPALVSQRTVEAVVGLPRRDYLRLAHLGAFPFVRERRLVVAKTVDVLAWFEQRIAHRDNKPANDADGESITLARVGARRVAR